jgi:uncharacterized membrane protein
MDFSDLAHLWVLFSLASAFFHASRLAVTKRLSLSFSTEVLTLYVNLASLVVTLPLVIWHHHFPFENPGYLMAVLWGGVISGLGGWSLNEALHRTEVSLVGPVMTLTPGFVIVIEWLLTGCPARFPGPGRHPDAGGGRVHPEPERRGHGLVPPFQTAAAGPGEPLRDPRRPACSSTVCVAFSCLSGG